MFFSDAFLGLAGMPRRIPDFPDSYNAWNNIASLGSCITMMSSAFFVYVVYVTITGNQESLLTLELKLVSLFKNIKFYSFTNCEYRSTVDR